MLLDETPERLVADLVLLLDMEPRGANRFEGRRWKLTPGRLFGGQVIAQALAAADTSNTFEPGQAVRVRIDLKNAKGKLLLTKGVEGVLTRKVGDRAWMLDVPDLKDGQGLVADYTELEVLP